MTSAGLPWASRWRGPLRVLAAVLAALALTSCGIPRGGRGPVAFPGLTSTEVSFTGSGGVTLHGTVVAPPADGTRRPAVVMLQGAGPVTRAEYRDEAEAYARRGLVVLVYDKRTAGYSSTHRDYSVLADDALAGVELLRARAEVDPAQTGLRALSEGAWVGALAAGRSPDVAFLVTVGAVGLSPARQQGWAYGEFLRHAGVSGSLGPALRDTALRQATAAGLFPEADYDPLPSWERVHQPVLALWGTEDREAAPVESSRLISRVLDRGGNTRYLVRFLPGARHNLRITRDGGFDRPDGLAPGGADLVADWIHGRPLPAGAAAPVQERASVALAPLAWYESSWGQLGALLLFAAAFLGYPLTAVVRRLRRRPDAVPVPAAVRRSARLLALLGGLTVFGTLGYLLVLMLDAAAEVGPVLAGRPLVWVMLQLLSAASVLTTIWTAVLAWRRRAELAGVVRARLGLLLGAGAVLLPWALYWRLLLP